MSLSAFILMLHTAFSPNAPPVDPPPVLTMVDLKVREWRTNRIPTSYQLTLTIEFP